MSLRLGRPLSLAACMAVAVLSLSACKQGEGDRCEIDNDCQSGLTCENPQGTSGHCTARQGVRVPDAGQDAPPRLDTAAPPTPDAPPDLAPDLPALDAATHDASDGGDAAHDAADGG
jgi:hypothetical protein